MWGNPLYYSLSRPDVEYLRLTGHESSVRSAVFSNDGTVILTASDDHTARVWDSTTGLQRLTLSGHSGPLYRAVFSLDDRVIFTTSADGTVRVWNSEDGSEIARLGGHSGRIILALADPSGSKIATASQGDRVIRIWRLRDFSEIGKLEAGAQDILWLEFVATRLLALSVSDDNSMNVWDVGDGVMVASMGGHRGTVFSARFSKDGKLAVTASNDRTARVWGASTGKEIAELLGHERGVGMAVFSANGEQVLTSSFDDTARLWSVEHAKELCRFEGHRRSALVAKFSPDEQKVATISDDFTARVWHADSGRELQCFNGHRGEITSVEFSADGEFCLTSSKDRTAAVWRSEARSGRAEELIHTTVSRLACFSNDCSKCLMTSMEGPMYLIDARDGKELAELLGHQREVIRAFFSQSGHLLASMSDDRDFRIWNAENGKEVRKILLEIDDVFASSGFDVLAARDGNVACIIDMRTGSESAIFEGHKDKLNSGAISLDGDKVLTISDNEDVKVWNRESGEEIFSMSFEYPRNPRDAIFSQDAKFALVAFLNYTVSLIDLLNQQEIVILPTHRGLIWRLKLPKSSSLILTLTFQRVLRLWTLNLSEQSVEKIWELNNVDNAEFFNNDSRILLTCGRMVAVAETISGRILGRFFFDGQVLLARYFCGKVLVCVSGQPRGLSAFDIEDLC